MELFNIVQEVHYSYGTLACMVHVLKMGYRGRSHDHGMTGHMIKSSLQSEYDRERRSCHITVM